MKKTSETITFFGSGPVAAESLRLLSQDFTIEAVITKPRPEHHRGPVPVLDVAEELRLPVFTAANKRELSSLFEQRPVHSKIAVLIDFGIIVSQAVIDYFPLGIINSHFSLLPEWRGADPLTFSILSGQSLTGVSLMLIEVGMDVGPLLAQGTYTIAPDYTTPQLTEDLIDLSHQMLVEILPRYIAGDIAPYPQDSTKEPTYSRKLSKDDSVLDWHKPAMQLEREIRAFAGWPKSRATFGRLEVVVTKAHVASATGTPGKTVIVDKKPVVYCVEDSLVLDMVKPAGKKEMTGEAFLAGYKEAFLGA